MKSRCYLLAILLGFSQVSGAYTRLTPERHHFYRLMLLLAMHRWTIMRLT